jgi:hypothetical protein
MKPGLFSGRNGALKVLAIWLIVAALILIPIIGPIIWFLL